MKKVLIALGICLVLTGCTANYNLEINRDLSFSENVTVLEDNRAIQNEYSNLETAIDARISDHYTDTSFKSYLKTNVIGTVTSGTKVTRNYKNFSTYSESYFLHYLFEKPTISETKGIITIKYKLLDDKGVFTDEPFDSEFYVSPIKINIKVPFKLLGGNFEEYDSALNTLSWVYNYDNIKDEIWFKFDKNIFVNGTIEEKMVQNNWYIYILFLIPVIIVGVSIYVYIK